MYIFFRFYIVLFMLFYFVTESRAFMSRTYLHIRICTSPTNTLLCEQGKFMIQTTIIIFAASQPFPQMCGCIVEPLVLHTMVSTSEYTSKPHTFSHIPGQILCKQYRYQRWEEVVKYEFYEPPMWFSAKVKVINVQKEKYTCSTYIPTYS